MSLRRNIIANYVGQGWSAIIGVLFVPVYIKYLGIEAYGLIGVFAVLQTWLSLLDIGMTPALGREMSRFRGRARDVQSIRDLLRSVEVIACGAAVVIAVGVWGASSWLAGNWLNVEALPKSEVAAAFSLMGVVTALRFAENVYKSSLVGLQQQVVMNIVTGIGATVRAVGAVGVLVWIAPTSTAFFRWQAVVSLGMLLAMSAAVYGVLPKAARNGRFSGASLLSIWRFAAGTFALTLLGFILSQSDKLILTKILSLEEFAHYALAFTVAAMIRTLAQPIDQSVYPKLTELLAAKDTARAADVYHLGAQLSVVLMGTAASFLVVFGKEVLQIWLQHGAVDLADRVYPIMALLTVGMMFNALLNGPYYLQMAAGWTSLLVKANVILAVIFVPSIFVLAKRYGAMGGAAAWIALNSLYIVVVVPLMHRQLLRTEMRKWFLNDLALPMLAAFLVLAAFAMFRPKHPQFLPLLLFLGGAFITAAVASAASASLVRPILLRRFGVIQDSA